MADNGAHPAEEDPAAAFLAQQESEIAVIENDGEGFGTLEGAGGLQPSLSANYGKFVTELMLANKLSEASLPGTYVGQIVVSEQRPFNHMLKIADTGDNALH